MPPPAIQGEALVRVESAYPDAGHAPLATVMMTLARDEELMQWALGGSSAPEAVMNRPRFHPATRVVVDVSLLSRAAKGTTARLLRTARSRGYWPFRDCYEQGERRVVKGTREARVRVTIGARGRVLASRGVSRGLDAQDARCFAAAARALEFTPGFGRRVDAELSIRTYAGDAPLPPRASEPLPAPVSDALKTAVSSAEPSLRSCYAEGLRRDPSLWGRLALVIEGAPSGGASASQATETSFPDPAVTDCVLAAIRDVALPLDAPPRFRIGVRFGAPPAPAPAQEAPAPNAPVDQFGEPPAPPEPLSGQSSSTSSGVNSPVEQTPLP